MKTNEKIRHFREQKNLTQEEMASELGLSTNGYANLERGETRINIERLEQIANVLGMDVTELIAFGEHNNNTIQYHHSTNNLNIIGQATDGLLEAEIAKLQLIISHKDELLEQKKREIGILNALIDSLKLK